MKKIKLQPNMEVHTSVKNRKRFKLKMWLIFLGLVLILLGCGACFTFGTVTWNPDQGFEPKPSIEHWWQTLLVVIGGVLAVAALVGFFLISFYIFRGFYNTQADYWKTAEFKKAKAKAKDMDLFKLKKKDLKWYKKMGYLTSDEFKQILEEQRVWIKTCKQENKKINYAKSKA